MVKEAESHAADDKKRRELVEAKNQGEALIHSTEKSLSDLGDKIAEGDKAAIESGINELRTALEGESREVIVSKIEALARAAMKIGDAVYKQPGGAESDQPGGGPEGGAAPSEGVVDAEFEEVRDDEGKKKSA
jgi:molecular chaperone DnaK